MQTYIITASILKRNATHNDAYSNLSYCSFCEVPVGYIYNDVSEAISDCKKLASNTAQTFRVYKINTNKPFFLVNGVLD